MKLDFKIILVGDHGICQRGFLLMFWMGIRRNWGGRYNKLMGNSTGFLDSNTDWREIIGLDLDSMRFGRRHDGIL